jgi:hypothetical protein
MRCRSKAVNKLGDLWLGVRFRAWQICHMSLLQTPSFGVEGFHRLSI